MISVFDKAENIRGKGEYTGSVHFLIFPECFQKLPSSRSLKLWMVWYRLSCMDTIERKADLKQAIHQNINSLPDNKILDWSKLKQFSDNILKCIKNEK